MTSILVVDNYDSFVFNLAQYLQQLGAAVTVLRNDDVPLATVPAYDGVLLSPGPGTPADSGVCPEIVREFGPQLPIFGVCLGHQAMGQAFGGKVIRAKSLMHGKTSPIHHDDTGVFAGLPNPFIATRYHSLIVEESSLPESLMVTAFTDAGEIMGLRHREYPVFGVQFHPESILTTYGPRLLRNFLELKVPVVAQ